MNLDRDNTFMVAPDLVGISFILSNGEKCRQAVRFPPGMDNSGAFEALAVYADEKGIDIRSFPRIDCAEPIFPANQ